MEHLLKSPLVLQSQKSSESERETRVTDARQRLCQAVRIQKGVSACDYLQLIYPGIRIHAGLMYVAWLLHSR